MQNKVILWKSECPGHCWDSGNFRLARWSWLSASTERNSPWPQVLRAWVPQEEEEIRYQEKLLDLLNQRDCLLAKSHSRVPVLTDPSARPLPGLARGRSLRSRQTIYKCHLQAGRKMAIWRQAQTMGNWALEPGRHSSQIVRGGEWPLVKEKRTETLALVLPF